MSDSPRPSSPSQDVLIRLHDKWEPEASQSSPKYRAATCVVCARPVHKMWHVWLNHRSGITRRRVTKELHFCRECGKDYGLFAD